MHFRLFLVRHASSEDFGQDPRLSEFGMTQAEKLARVIEGHIPQGESVDFWSSTAKRAVQTAWLIQQRVDPEGEVLTEAKLVSSDTQPEDCQWLADKIASFTRDNLVIVTHEEYVRHFPTTLGCDEEYFSKAGGIILTSGEPVLISWRDADASD